MREAGKAEAHLVVDAIDFLGNFLSFFERPPLSEPSGGFLPSI
jgi:hypothetical protein